VEGRKEGGGFAQGNALIRTLYIRTKSRNRKREAAERAKKKVRQDGKEVITSQLTLRYGSQEKKVFIKEFLK